MDEYTHKIEMTCWYQECGGITQKERLPQEFEHIEDAFRYLGDNADWITEHFPVDSVEIIYIKKDKK